MTSTGTIYMDYQLALSQARSLREEAARLKNIAEGSLEETVHNLRNQWSGPAADAYIQKCTKLKSEILSSAKQLETLAGKIETAAKEAKAADERAVQIANNLRELLNKIMNK